jgi:hypothetical protein
MDNQADHRTYERKGLALPLMLEKWAPEWSSATDRHFEVYGVDISSGGIGITTPQALRVGEVVKVEYPLNGSGMTLPVYSEVVWTQAAQGTARAGLRFLM